MRIGQQVIRRHLIGNGNTSIPKFRFLGSNHNVVTGQTPWMSRSITSSSSSLMSFNTFGTDSNGVKSFFPPHSMINKPLSVPSQIRWMSSDDDEPSDAAYELADILAREEQEELDTGNSEIPEDLVELQRSLEEYWKIVVNDTADGVATVHLYSKDASPPKVQVSFHCQDTVEDITEGYDDGGEGADDEEEPMSPVRFTVTATKAGKTLTMQCLSEFGQAKIETASTTTGNNSDPDAIHSNQGVSSEKTLYQGPEFSELAEDLQDAFAVYLEETCGVNSDVATFVAMYSDYKEQLHYVNFLKDAQSIVKP